MERRTARSVVYKMLFATRFYENIEDNQDFELLLSSASDGEIVDDLSMDYIKTTFNGVMDSLKELKDMVISKITTYTADRIYPADLTAMVYGAYEILYAKDIPTKVAISEAVNLVKKFSTEKSVTFVNGVLSSILKDKHE